MVAYFYKKIPFWRIFLVDSQSVYVLIYISEKLYGTLPIPCLHANLVDREESHVFPSIEPIEESANVLDIGRLREVKHIVDPDL